MATAYGYHAKISDDELQEISIKVEASLYRGVHNEKSPVMAVLLRHKDLINNWLQESNMTHTQIQRLLVLEGVHVSERSINRFIGINFPKLPKYTVHLVTNPGKEAQVDFGYVGMMKNKLGEMRKAYAFVMTLSHSRYRYVEFVFSQCQVTWAQLHINAFQFFGGAPLRIVLDNLKAGVLKPDIFDPTLNETYAELSRFYGFAIDPAKAYHPEAKGKVERSIRIVKEQLIAGRTYSDITSANEEAVHWCKHEISHRICSSMGKKPIDVFEAEERYQLLKLPSSFFDIAEWTTAKVHRDHHFIAKGNFYSVPTCYIGENVNIRIGLKTVSAYFEHKIIKIHPRHYDKGQWITDQKDYPEGVLHYLEKTPEVCLDKAKAIGPSTHHMVSISLEPFTRTGLRKAQGILRLTDKYSNERLELACKRAIAYDNYNYKSLENILKNKLEEETTEQSSNNLITGAQNPHIANKENVCAKFLRAIKLTSRTPVLKLYTNSYVRSKDEYVSSMEVNYASK